MDGTPWIHNCLTLLLRKSSSPAPAPTTAEATALANARACFDWYNASVRLFDESTNEGDFAIFGAGMAGIALLTQLTRKPVLILDEDRHRNGSQLEGVTIKPPDQAPSNLKVIMPFAHDNAVRIVAKVRAEVQVASTWQFIIPAASTTKR